MVGCARKRTLLLWAAAEAARSAAGGASPGLPGGAGLAAGALAGGGGGAGPFSLVLGGPGGGPGAAGPGAGAGLSLSFGLTASGQGAALGCKGEPPLFHKRAARYATRLCPLRLLFLRLRHPQGANPSCPPSPSSPPPQARCCWTAPSCCAWPCARWSRPTAPRSRRGGHAAGEQQR
jgi:hypothetical protein